MKSLSEMLSAGILLNTFLEFNFIGIFLLTKVKQGHCKKKNQVLQKYNWSENSSKSLFWDNQSYASVLVLTNVNIFKICALSFSFDF